MAHAHIHVHTDCFLRRHPVTWHTESQTNATHLTFLILCTNRVIYSVERQLIYKVCRRKFLLLGRRSLRPYASVNNISKLLCHWAVIGIITRVRTLTRGGVYVILYTASEVYSLVVVFQPYCSCHVSTA